MIEAPPTAKRLLLELLLAAGDRPLTAREAVVACSLFGIRETNARVTLVRLASAGLVEAVERGSYRLGPAAVGLAAEVAQWRTAETRLRAWDGGYVVVASPLLVRSDRTAMRHRERALDMLGFRELERGLHVRPDSVEASIDVVRARLVSLGLEASAAVFLGRGFDARREERLRELWDGEALNAGYRQTTQALERWLRGASRLAPEVAAREAFLLGGRAIRQVVLDPMLPPPFVDADARRSFFETVRRFDEAGHAIWWRLLDASGRREPHVPIEEQSP